MKKKTLACKTPRSCSTSSIAEHPNSSEQVAALSDSAPGRCSDDHKSEDPDRSYPEICIQERTNLNGVEKHRCIKCDKVGKMLVCSEIGCPVTIHEDCLIPVANFDDLGNFYCPYCSYKRAVATVQRLKRRAILAKEELSRFLKVAAVDDGNGKEHEYENIEKTTTAAPHSEDKNQHDDEISLKNDQLNQRMNENVTIVSEKCDPKVEKNDETCRVRILPDMTVSKEHKKIESSEKTKKADGESTKGDASENESHESHSESVSEGSEDMEQNNNTTKPSSHATRNLRHKRKEENVFPLHGKRKRLMWTSEEENMLKDGVQIFSDPKKKNLPWRKILQFGSHVFHETRAPADLQNKWKNMTKR